MNQAAGIATCSSPALETLEVSHLVHEHGAAVRALLRRLLGDAAEADDVLQEVFLLAWRKRASMTQGGSALAWLRDIAIKRASASRRRARVRRLFGVQLARENIEWQTPERAAERTDAQRAVYAILDGISEKRRTVFILFELQGMSGQEIADALGCPLKTVWTRLHHARHDFLRRTEALRARALREGWRY